MLHVSAQTNIQFDHITSEKGLSQNDVNTIIQDDQGFMWFGTHDGLNKFDGYSFKIFRNQENDTRSIPNNLVRNLVKDKDGNLWMINTNAGITKFNPVTEEFTNYHHIKGNLNSAPNSVCASLYIDFHNRLWVSTRAGLSLFEINVDNDNFNHYTIIDKKTNAPISINSVFQTSDEQIWVGTEHGLFKAFFNGKSNITFVDFSNSLGLNFKPQVQAFSEDDFGNFFIGTGNIVLQKPKDENQFLKIFETTVFDLESDNENNLWVASVSGLHKLKYDKKNNVFTPEETFQYDISQPLGLNRTSIRSLYKDQSGIFWAGTKGGGVNKFSPKNNPFVTVKKSLNKKSLSYNNIRTLYRDSQNTLWVGTEDGNLNFSNSSNVGKLKFEEIENTRNVFALEEIEINGRLFLYIGRQSDVNFSRIPLKKGKQYSEDDVEVIRNFRSSVFAIKQTQEKTLWIGTYAKGIFRYIFDEKGTAQISQFTPQNSNLNSQVIRSFLEDTDGNLWIGTADGLHFLSKDQFHNEKITFKIFKHNSEIANSISNNYILDIYQSKSGTIWVGTLGGGLNKFYTDNKGQVGFEHFNTNKGLPNDIVKAIEEDAKGNLWLSSNKGLSKFEVATKSFVNFSTSDGLQGEEFLELSSLNTQDGYLYFGGTNGINIFKPTDVLEHKINKKPLFTNFYVLNDKVNIGEEKNGRIILNKGLNYQERITLKPKENSFSIEFSSTSYISSEKNKFRYLLEGFDADWQLVDAKKRFATYTNIPSGNYVFKIETTNGTGGWSKSDKRIHIKVETPWWKSTIAFSGYALLLSLLLIAFRRFTIVRAEEKHQYEVNKLEKKKSEELQQMKLEFFTNISHEFRTPLTLIKGPLDVLEKNNENWNATQRQKQYNLMKKNTNYLLRLVNQLLDFRRMDRQKMTLKISNLDLVVFVEETSGPFTFLATKKQIDFKIVASQKHLVIPFDPDALEKILNNLLFNAFKFTPEGHKITLEIHDGNDYSSPNVLSKKLNLSDYIVIQIKDTGKGISTEKLHHIFERYYTDRDKNIEGAGIGLSFTKNLVELHDGFIDVHSIENVGTTFTVLLPKYQDEIATSKLIELEKEAQAEQPLNLAPDLKSLAYELKEDLAKSYQKTARNEAKNRVKILIVEDNEDIREFIKNGVQADYQILEAVDGKEGFELAEKFRPQVIISDIMMPVMDGFEMVSKLIESDITSNIPVIMLTAKSSKESEKQALKLGVVDFIRKPFDLDVLLLKVNNVLEKQQQLRNEYHGKISLEPKEIEVTSSEEIFLQQAMQIVEENMMNTDFSVEMLVSEMGMSRSNLYLKIKESTGLSSSEFIRSVRLKRAVQLLKKSDMSVKEIMYMTGFNTASYFSKCFKKQYGVVPSEYMKTLNKDRNTLKDYLS